MIIFGANHLLAQQHNSKTSSEPSPIGMEQISQALDDEIKSFDLINEGMEKTTIPMAGIVVPYQPQCSLISPYSWSETTIYFFDVTGRTSVFITGPPNLFYLNLQNFTYA